MNFSFTKRHFIAFAIFIGFGVQIQAQVGIGTDNPDSSSILDVQSSDKGVLIPRMNSATRSAISNPATGLMVFDTDTSSFWYFNGNAWQNLSSGGGGGGGAHPWNMQGTNNPAGANTDNIYSMGSVAIGKNQAVAGIAFDVNGSVRAGNVDGGATIGANSVAFGNSTKAVGNNSAAFGTNSSAGNTNAVAFGTSTSANGENAASFGYNSTASGKHSVAFGRNSNSSGESAVSFGEGASAEGDFSFAVGLDNAASGELSVSFGEGTEANSLLEAVFGSYNILSGGTPDDWIDSDVLFAVGNGTSNRRRSNAITILKDGWTGIGYNTKQGAEKLRVNGSIATAAGTYPDYVFENYFDNISEINSAYNFSSLENTKEFIERNRHLPGVTPITELERTEDGGYSFNMTELSIQSLEKIEELFLYVIEQNEKTKELNAQLEKLKTEKELLKTENKNLEKQLLEFNKRLEALETKM